MALSTPVLIIVGIWAIALVRLATLRRFHMSKYWITPLVLCFYAIYQTTKQETSYLYLLHFYRPETLYLVCSLALSGVGFGLLLYVLALYAFESDHASTATMWMGTAIPKMGSVQRTLLGWALVVPPVVLVCEGFWGRPWLAEHATQPTALQVEHPALVVSRIVLHGYMLAVLWLGLVYPATYIIRHKDHIDPNARWNGLILRLKVLIVAVTVVSMQATTMLASTVLIFVVPHWQAAISMVGMWLAPRVSVATVIMLVLLFLPLRLYAKVQICLLCRRLGPLHAFLYQVAPGVFLPLLDLHLWDKLMDFDTLSFLRVRIRSEITDARRALYATARAQSCAVPQTVPPELTQQPMLPTSKELQTIAAWEAALLVKFVQDQFLPPVPSTLSAAPFQTETYYSVLAIELEHAKGRAWARRQQPSQVRV